MMGDVEPVMEIWRPFLNVGPMEVLPGAWRYYIDGVEVPRAAFVETWERVRPGEELPDV